MRSPFSFTGTLHVDDPTATVETAAAAVEQALRDANVGQLQVAPASIRFRGAGRSYFAGWTVGPVSSAEITFTRTSTGVAICYRYSAIVGFAVATCIATLLAILSGFGVIYTPVPTMIVVAALLLLVACSRYFHARSRFPQFLAETVGVRSTSAPRVHVRDAFRDY